jgi:hypothetical protein
MLQEAETRTVETEPDATLDRQPTLVKKKIQRAPDLLLR